MKDLIKAREEIDLIDTEIIRLFEKRMDIVKMLQFIKLPINYLYWILQEKMQC